MDQETRTHHAMAAVGGFFGVYALLTRGGTFGSSETSNLIYLVVSGLDGTWGPALVRLGGTACYIAGIVLAVLLRRSGKTARLRWGALGINLAACLGLARVPAEYDRIVIVVNIYQAVQRKQHFGMIKNAFIRLVDARNNMELCRYNLTEDYSGMTAMVFGEVYRHNGEWKFNAIGQGTNDNSVGELANRYIVH